MGRCGNTASYILYLKILEGGILTRAREYYEKYEDSIREDPEKAAVALLKEFSGEVKELCDKRHVKKDGAIYAILRELNQKWNALSNIVKKEQGASPIRVDGFRRFYEMKMSELEGRI